MDASRRKRVWLYSTVLAVLVISCCGVGTVAALIGWNYRLYRVPENGMYPGIPAGSRVTATLRPYGDASQVKRGDVVVLSHREGDTENIYIWRVVGLPGDKVRTTKDAVYINGQPLALAKVRSEGPLTIFRETNGEASYEVAYGGAEGGAPAEVEVVVPAGHVFVLGDNRDLAARDSRSIGPVALSSIVAKKW